MTDTLDRRTLLKLLAALSVTASSSGALTAQQTAESGAGVLGGLGEVKDDAIRDLAKAYVSNHDDPSGVDAMVERLRGTDFTNDELVLQLRQEMHSDFDAGQTVTLHGWIVSRTEARVVAAVARLLA